MKIDTLDNSAPLIHSSPQEPIVAAVSRGPRYLRMAAELRKRISSRELQPGDRLPSFAEMRNNYGATVSTVERVYGLLEKEGLVERVHGQGTFVTTPCRVKTGNLGFVTTGSLHNSDGYYQNLMESVRQRTEAQGYHLLCVGTDVTWNQEVLKKVDGVLLCGIERHKPFVHEIATELPLVSLLTSPAGFCSVVADDYGGGCQATRHLLELGHLRIACIMEQIPSLPHRRLTAYIDTLLGAEIRPEPGWICRTTNISYLPAERRMTYLQWGRETMRRWLQEDWAEQGCTAIIAQNDLAAAGVMQELQEAGIDVPGQVSIIGFDGTKACEYFIPRLTTVKVPLARIGSQAVDVLLQQIESKQRNTTTFLLPTEIQQGDSTAPPQ